MTNKLPVCPFRRLLLLALCLTAASILPAQTVFTIAGDIAQPVEVSAADLAAMPRHSTILTHEGNSRTYEGVLLYDLLAKAGVPFGKAMTGKAMASYLLVTARDGYQVVFALPEIDPSFEGAKIILADKVDGGPLPAKEQPVRLIAPQDKMQARSIYSATKAEFVRLRK